jgi:hypothetical protein
MAAHMYSFSNSQLQTSTINQHGKWQLLCNIKVTTSQTQQVEFPGQKLPLQSNSKHQHQVKSS